MKIILQCTNLVGDSIYLLRPVEKYLDSFQDAVAIVADRGLSFELFANCFASRIAVYEKLEEAQATFPDAIVLSLSAGAAGEVAFANIAKEGRQLHISEGYAKMLGVTVDTIVPLKSWFRAQRSHLLDPCILISPFSASCTVHSTGVANKTLADWKWEHIIRYLRKQKLPVKVLAGPKDYMRCSVPLNDYITAKSLYDLELLMRSCKLFVGVDNGLGHIAATLDVPMISLWPKVSSVEFIGPIYGKKTTFLQMEPNLAAPVSLMVGLRKFTQMLLNGTYENRAKAKG